MAAMGRPMKGKNRRIQTTIYAESRLLDIIESIVAEKQNGGESGYSRSEFYHEAAVMYLKHLGKMPEEEENEE
jgi:hypothetical protein